MIITDTLSLSPRYGHVVNETVDVVLFERYVRLHVHNLILLGHLIPTH